MYIYKLTVFSIERIYYMRRVARQSLKYKSL